MVEEWLKTALQGTALDDAVEAIYWLEAPSQAPMPYVVYWQVDDPSDKTFLSQYGGQARIQFDIWSRNRFDIADKRKAVRDTVRELRGRYGDLYIMSAVVANDFSRELPDDELYSGVVDVVFEWQEINND